MVVHIGVHAGRLSSSPMDPAQALLQEADWCARAMQASKEPTAPDALLRARMYKPKVDHVAYLCPRCWVKYGARSRLRSVTSDTDDYDLLRCAACDGDFIIPL